MITSLGFFLYPSGKLYTEGDSGKRRTTLLGNEIHWQCATFSSRLRRQHYATLKGANRTEMRGNHAGTRKSEKRREGRGREGVYCVLSTEGSYVLHSKWRHGITKEWDYPSSYLTPYPPDPPDVGKYSVSATSIHLTRLAT